MDSGKSDRSQAKVEQIVSEFFAKSLQIILEARIPSIFTHKHFDPSKKALPVSSEVRKQDQWFNLVLGNSNIPRPSTDFRITHPQELMVVDILLSQQPGDYFDILETSRNNSTTGCFLNSIGTGRAWPTIHADGGQILLERWFVEFKSSTGAEDFKGKSDAIPKDSAGSPLVSNMFSDKSRRADTTRKKTTKVGHGSFLPSLPSNAMEVPLVYKKTIIMLRSVYSMAKLLPAYQLFRLSCSSPRSCGFTLSYKLSASPISEVDKTEESAFCFTPIDTCWGQMIIKVVYHAAASQIASESSTSVTPQIIADYMGCPTIGGTKKLSDEPLIGSLPISGLSGRKVHVSSASSLPDFTSGSLFGSHPWWESGLDNVYSTLLPPSSSPSHVESSLSCSNLDDSFTSFASHISDGSTDSRIPQVSQNRAVSAPIPIVQNRQLQASSHFMYSGGSPVAHNTDNLQRGPSSQISLQVSEKTVDSRPAHCDRKASPSSTVKHPLKQGSFSRAIALPPLSRSNSNIPRPNTYGLKALLNKPGNYREKDIRLREQQVPSHRSHLNPFGEPSPSDKGMMHFGSAPDNVFTGLTIPQAAAFGSLGKNWQLNSLEGNIEKVSDSASRPVYMRKPSLILRSLDKKGKGVEDVAHTEDDAFTFPFAIDQDEHEQRRLMSVNVSKAPTGKHEFTHHRSRGAAAGELILMLKAAAPLCQQDDKVTKRDDVGLKESAGDSVSKRPSFSIPRKGTIQFVSRKVRTASDALEELEDYKEMRDSLLRQSGRK